MEHPPPSTAQFPPASDKCVIQNFSSPYSRSKPISCPAACKTQTSPTDSRDHLVNGCSKLPTDLKKKELSAGAAHGHREPNRCTDVQYPCAHSLMHFKTGELTLMIPCRSVILQFIVFFPLEPHRSTCQQYLRNQEGTSSNSPPPCSVTERKSWVRA